MTVTTPKQTKMRADAVVNRAKILEVAHAALSESSDASLNSIAQRAGVGPGTLYRHFPTREDLILEVYRHDIAKLVASVDALLSEYDPLEALRIWLTDLAAYIEIKHGLGEALDSATNDMLRNETYEPILDGLQAMLSAGHSAGVVREGVDPGDVLAMSGCLWRTPDGPDGHAQQQRLLDLMLRSLAP
jgi:AcrR family transcriptional regulator